MQPEAGLPWAPSEAAESDVLRNDLRLCKDPSKACASGTELRAAKLEAPVFSQARSGLSSSLLGLAGRHWRVQGDM